MIWFGYTVEPWLSEPQLSKCSITQNGFLHVQKMHIRMWVTVNCCKCSHIYWTYKWFHFEMFVIFVNGLKLWKFNFTFKVLPCTVTIEKYMAKNAHYEETLQNIVTSLH